MKNGWLSKGTHGSDGSGGMGYEWDLAWRFCRRWQGGLGRSRVLI